MIHLGIYDGPNGKLLMDATGRGAFGIKASTNRHGFERLIATVPVSLAEAWQLYDYGAPPWALLRANGHVLFEGRLADPELISETTDGIALQAVGMWDVFSDIPYTALWSHTRTSDWRPVRTTEVGSRAPDRYTFDVNNRLYIAPNKGAVHFGGAGTPRVGGIAYRAPNAGSRALTRLTFNYDVVAPSADWAFGWNDYTAAPGNAGWTAAGGATIITGSGTGSSTITLSANAVAVQVWFYQASGAAAALAAETGVNRAIITNVRVTSQATPITAANIAADLVTTVATLNSSQLDASTAQIGAGLSLPDITNAVYQDADMRRILDNLVARGDSAGGLLEAAVWEDRRLTLQARGASGRTWATDAASLRLRRPLDSANNSMYATYRESDGFTLRTATVANAQSVARLGMTRRGVIDADTTSSTEAGRWRDLALTDRAQPRPTARYTLSLLQDIRGAIWPRYMLRAGDTLNVRGIPSGFGATVDQLRIVRISRTDYDADTDTITFEPEAPLISLETMLAQRDARR